MKEKYIYYHKDRDFFTVSIRVRGKKVHFGTFRTLEEAISTRDEILETMRENSIPLGLRRNTTLTPIERLENATGIKLQSDE